MVSYEESFNHNTSLEWLVEGRILLLDVKTNAVEETSHYDQKIVDRINSTPHEVDLVMKMPEFAFQTPPSLKQLTSFKYQRHPRLGYVVFISNQSNPLVRFLLTTVASVRRLKMQAYETLDEAMTFLVQTRNLSL